MPTMLTAAALVLSLAGYACYLTWRGLRPALVPALVSCGLICALFFASLADGLRIAFPLLLGTGVALGGFACWRMGHANDRFAPLRGWCRPEHGAMVCLLVVLALCTRGATFVHYDDFSHWAPMARHLALTHSLPDAAGIITFQAYPPGSALWIYWVTRCIGFTEGQAMFAQAALMVFLLWALLAALPSATLGQRCLPAMTLVAASAVILFGNAMIRSLLVDTLLCAAGLAAFAVLYTYRDDPVQGALWTLPIAVATVLIKNSGAFFVLLHAGLSCGLVLRKRSMGRSWPAPLCCLAVPLACLGLWLAHVQAVFPAGMTSRHALSLQLFAAEGGQKTAADLLLIAKEMARVVLHPSSLSLRRVLLWHVSLLGVAALLKRSDGQGSKRCLAALLYADGAFALYVLGLYGMYILTMPIGEARALSEVHRYLNTGLFYGVGVLSMVCAGALSASPMPRRALGCGVLCVALSLTACYGTRPLSGLSVPAERAHWVTRSARLRDVLSQGPVERPLAVYAPAPDYEGYTAFACIYLLNDRDFTFISDKPGPVRMAEIMSAHRMLAVVDPDEGIARALLEHWGATDGAPGLYVPKRNR